MVNYRSFAKQAYRKYPAIKRRAKVYVPAVRQLASDVLYLKGLINSEPKNHLAIVDNNVNWSGVVISLCDVPQGDGSINRDGDRVLPRYLGIHMTCNRTATCTTVHQQLRVIIFRFWGESANAVGALPAVADIIDHTGSIYAPRSFLDQAITGPRGDRQRRIEVLRNYYTSLSPDKTYIDIQENIEMNGKTQNRKEHLEYFDNTTNPPTSGGVFVLIVTDNTLSEAAYHLTSKLTYYDN